MAARYPLLFQVNTRVLLGELGKKIGRQATLNDLPDDLLDQLARWKFEWFWPLGVWTTGPAAQAISRGNEEWRREMTLALPDLTDADITGSPFAICAYDVHPDFGGPAALAELRKRLKTRGMKLMTDFVPNHTAPDHPWVYEHPEYYIAGDEQDWADDSQNYLRVQTHAGPMILAHGRDPYFPGWPDTLQLNYCSPALRQAQEETLLHIAEQCDGVRCDMAMLLLPDVIQRTWGHRANPSDGTERINTSFWPDAIARVRNQHADFTFMAEVYWDLEWQLQLQGFDYTYDKRLYDRLVARQAQAVRGHLHADLEFQSHCARFLENHDEPRAAAVFPPDVHRAAATITFLTPGLRFFHEGQLRGRKQKVSMHVGRRIDEPLDAALQQFYERLLTCLHTPAIRDGQWQLLDCQPEWEGNFSHQQLIACTWEHNNDRWLICVNFGAGAAQGFIHLPWGNLVGKTWKLQDHLNPDCYERAGSDLASRGLYVSIPGWKTHAFQVSPFG